MTTDTIERPAHSAADGYTPDCYVLHVNSVINWRRGLSHEEMEAAKLALAEAVVRAAGRIAGDEVTDVDDAGIAWPHGLTPQEYVDSLARRLAAGLWDRYTDAQRERMTRYAARYTRNRVRGLQRDLASGPRITRAVSDSLPYEVRVVMMSRFHEATERARRLTVLLAYIETHPGDEASGEELAMLADLVKSACTGHGKDHFPFF